MEMADDPLQGGTLEERARICTRAHKPRESVLSRKGLAARLAPRARPQVNKGREAGRVDLVCGCGRDIAPFAMHWLLVFRAKMLAPWWQRCARSARRLTCNWEGWISARANRHGSSQPQLPVVSSPYRIATPVGFNRPEPEALPFCIGPNKCLGPRLAIIEFEASVSASAVIPEVRLEDPLKPERFTRGGTGY